MFDVPDFEICEHNLEDLNVSSICLTEVSIAYGQPKIAKTGV